MRPRATKKPLRSCAFDDPLALVAVGNSRLPRWRGTWLPRPAWPSSGLERACSARSGPAGLHHIEAERPLAAAVDALRREVAFHVADALADAVALVLGHADRIVKPAC